MITIDTESHKNIKSILDIDFWRERYKTDNNLYTFPSPSLFTIEQNYYYLLRNSKIKTFEPKYKMKPSTLSYDEYKTTIFGWFLMNINGIFCIEDFDLNEVIIPSIESISVASQNKVSQVGAKDLTSIGW